MNIASIGMRNIWRNKTRTALTIMGGAVGVLAFVLLRTFIWAWNVQIEYAAKDRLATRHKVSFILSMPKKYVEQIREVPGVTQATWANWFGAKDPNHKDEFFATLAVDPPSFLAVYNEASVSPEDKERWFQDRKGAIVGDVLARKLGLKVGDKITLQGTIYPGDWEFNIDGIYYATQKSLDRSQFLFHWDYVNESFPAGNRRRDMVGWIVSRVSNPVQSPNITAAIDKIFDEKDIQTATMSEQAMNNSFMAMFSAILKAFDIVSIIILLIMTLILGNTIAMGVRERTREYGVLKALGFSPGHVRTFVIGEAFTVGTLSGVFGLVFAYLIVDRVLGRFLEENFGSWFPYFRVTAQTAVVAVLVSIVLGVVSSLLPARQAGRLAVVDALRRVD